MASDNETRDMFVEMASRLFSEQATREIINAFEKGTWPADLWRQVEEAGLPWAAVPESAGGAGGNIGDLMAVLREAGRNAVPLPLAETGLGAMIAGEAGLTPPPGPLALVISESSAPIRIAGGKVSGKARRVAFASVCDNIIVVSSGEVAIVAKAAVKIDARQGQTGEPYDDVTFDNAAASASASSKITPECALELAALARTSQMSGAADRILAITTQYAKERTQFGRSISTFQAIQHMLAELSTYVAAVAAAARTAARDAEEGDGSFAIWAAKTQASDAAHKICAIAHQSMGAMGFTYEHILHHYTRRLWVWRRDYGSESFWGAKLGRAMCEAGPDAMWPSLTSSKVAA
ncbi:MAG: acyl-CoA/acyl-ACP dehydrogenase [Alphaproteobacteria bacterium]|nr:acyl-CoA/acyl-ACP dehydrogenase [Alphaproteobacteria bacterium]MCW5739403.1 acyl-CoA/acyl-ACP dehydrogenase [Alphaproteobacteria bacterium]